MSKDKYPSIFSPQMETIVFFLVYPTRAGGIIVKYASFQNCARCEKDLKDNKHNSLHLVRKYARISVLGHYLFLEANRLSRARLSENCSPLATDNVRVMALSVHCHK